MPAFVADARSSLPIMAKINPANREMMGQSTQFIVQPDIACGHGDSRAEIRYAHQFMTATPQESTRNTVDLGSSAVDQRHVEHLGSNMVTGSSRVAEPSHPDELSVAGSGRARAAGYAGPTFTMGPPMEPVAPVEMPANRRVVATTRRNKRNGSIVDCDSPVMVGRNLRAFLNKLAINQGSPVTFGSIDGPLAPIPSFRPYPPARRLPSLASPSMTSSQTAAAAISTPVPKLDKKGIAELFQGPSVQTAWSPYYVRLAQLCDDVSTCS
jgi:hypothetical protein